MELPTKQQHLTQINESSGTKSGKSELLGAKMKIVRKFCLMPFLLLGACGNDPPCGEAGVVKTARNLATKFVINISLPVKFPEEIDLSSPIEFSSITVAKWDPTLRSAVCNTRYRLDQTALLREVKLEGQALDNPALKKAIANLPDRGMIVNGTIVYTVERTTDGDWWINLMDMRPD